MTPRTPSSGGERSDPTGSFLPPDRLWETVEAINHAVHDVAEHLGGRKLHPLEIHGGPMQPASLKEFTRFEIEEACRFLTRMGMLEAQAPKQSNDA